MNGNTTTVKQHPILVIVGGVVLVVNGLIALIFGWPIIHADPTQIGLVAGVVNPITTVLSALVAQKYTTPYDPEQGNTADNTAILRQRVDELETSGSGGVASKPTKAGRTQRRR